MINNHYKALKLFLFALLLVLFNLNIFSSSQTDSLLIKADNFFQVNYDSAIFYYNKSLKKITDEKLKMHCLSNISVTYNDLGKIDTAISIIHLAIDIGLENKYDTLLSEAYLRLGNYYKQLEDFDNAKFYYKKSLELHIKESAYGALGILYSHIKQSDSAIIYLNKSADIFLQSDTSTKETKIALSSVYGQLAITYFDNNKSDEGFTYFNKSLKYAKEAKNPINIISAMLNLSSAYSMLNNTEEAEVYLKKALNIADTLGNLRIKNNINQRLYEHYYQIENFKQAYDYLSEYQKGKDSLINLKYQDDFRKNEIDFNIKLQKAELNRVLLKKEKQRIIYLFISFIILVILIISVIVFYKKLRSKNKETDNLKTNLEQVIKRMSDLNNHIAKQNKYITEIEKQYEANNTNEELQKELEKQKILRNEDWDKYVNIFNILFPDFLNKISNTYPNLSDGDKKQLIMLKLNYTREKAAHILGVSPDSIKKARQRLSKKLGLKNILELNNFISKV